MIHISQEELFRKIVQEHPVESGKSQLEGSGQLSLSAQLGAQKPSAQSSSSSSTQEAHLRASRRLVSGTNLQTASLAATHSAITGNEEIAARVCGREQDKLESGHKEMSSILSRTGSSARDSNNNSTPCDEDEIQVVLITGCGSKIGSNIAVAFAARGLKVALVDIDIKETEEVAKQCQDKSPKNRAPLQIVADISQLAEAHKVIDRTIEAFGRLDVLVNTVNNASLIEAKFQSGSGDDDPHVFEQYHKIIASNMHSVTYLCISAAPYLRKTKGSIVNVSSITNNETSCSYKFAYCMSKAGISTLTKCLATDLAPDIKVICVSPKSDN